MSDYDFFDDGFDEMLKEQKSKTSTKKDTKFPISYFGAEGTYIFRIYPENYNGKPRLRRVVWSNQLHNYRRVICPKGDNRIDDLVKQAQEQKLDSKSNGFWRHKRSQDAIFMVYLISAPTNKNIQKAGTATAAVMNWLQLQSLESFFDSLEEEGVSLRKFLHPGKPSNAIKMRIDKVQKGKKTETLINVSATAAADFELPPMEEVLPSGVTFPGLDNIHVREDSILTDELFEEFKKDYDERVQKILEFRSQDSHNPEDNQQEQGYEVNFDDDEPKQSVK